MRRTFPSTFSVAALCSLDLWLGCGLDERADSGGYQGSLNTPVSILCPAGEKRLIVLDRGASALITVERSTGELSQLSAGNLVGQGPELLQPLLMTQAHEGGSVLVLVKDGDGEDVVQEIDLETGNRSTLLVLEPNDDLPLAATANDLVLTEDGSHLLVADEQAGLISIDLDSGERSTLGEIPGIAKGLAIRDENHVWVAVVGLNSFVRIALDTGATSDAVPPLSGSPKDLVLTQDSDAVALFGGGPTEDGELNHGLRHVDLASSEQEQISGGEQGDGPEFGLPTSFCLDDETQEAFVLDGQEHALFKVELASGERTIITRW